MAKTYDGSLWFDTKINTSDFLKDLKSIEDSFSKASKSINADFNAQTSKLLRSLMGNMESVSSSMQKTLLDLNAETKDGAENFQKITDYFYRYGAQMSESFVSIVESGNDSLEDLQKILAENFKETGVSWDVANKAAETYITTLKDADKQAFKSIDADKVRKLGTTTKEMETATKAVQKQVADFVRKTKGDFDKAFSDLKNSFSSFLNKVTIGIGVATTGLAIFGKSAADAAMQIENAKGQMDRIFGKSADVIKNFASSAADSLGVSKGAAFEMSAIYGNLLNGFIKDSDALAGATQDLIHQSAVIASATGRSIDDVMNRIRSGLLGSTEAIEDLGVNVNIAMLESTNAFRQFAGDKSWSQLDFQTQQQIRLNAILEQSVEKYGKTLKDTSSGAIAQASASFDDLKSEIGQSLLPVIKVVMPEITKIFKDFRIEVTKPEMQEKIKALGVAFGEMAKAALEFIRNTMPSMLSSLKWILDNGGNIAKVVVAIFAVSKIYSFASGIGIAVSSMTALFKALQTAKAAQIAFNIAALANPYVLTLTVAITAAAGAVYLLKKGLEKFAEYSKEAAEKEKKTNSILRQGYIKRLESMENLTEEQRQYLKVLKDIEEREARIAAIRNGMSLKGYLDTYKKIRKEMEEQGKLPKPNEKGTGGQSTATAPIDEDALKKANEYIESLNVIEERIARFGASEAQIIIFDKEKALKELDELNLVALGKTKESAEAKTLIEEEAGLKLNALFIAQNEKLNEEKIANDAEAATKYNEAWEAVALSDEQRKIAVLTREKEERDQFMAKYIADDDELQAYLLVSEEDFQRQKKNIIDTNTKKANDTFDMQKLRTDILKDSINNLGSAFGTFIQSVSAGEPVMKAFGNMMVSVVATAVEGFGQALVAQSAIAFIAQDYAKGAMFLAGGLAAIAAAQALKMIKFEQGGVVPGSSYSGDKIHAMVNSGEVILNREQQANLLFSLSNKRLAGAGAGTNLNVVVNNNASNTDIDANYNPNMNTLEVTARNLVLNTLTSRQGKNTMVSNFNVSGRFRRTT